MLNEPWEVLHIMAGGRQDEDCSSVKCAWDGSVT